MNKLDVSYLPLQQFLSHHRRILDSGEINPDIERILTAGHIAIASGLQVPGVPDVSFVIRTIFRRQHMLNRCIVAIEYLRRILCRSVEVVIATDADSELSGEVLESLRKEFPFLAFVMADSRSRTERSRVRNLIAGILQASAPILCIVDDDDWFTPQAAKSIQVALDTGGRELVLMTSRVVIEEWVQADGMWQREARGFGAIYTAEQWPVIFRGYNSLPLCSVVHPAWFLRLVLKEYLFRYDFSEDFILHLLLFSHPNRPPIRIVSDDVGAYQSHRLRDGDNVSTVEDKSQWCADTGNALFDLLFNQGRTFELTSGREADLRALELAYVGKKDPTVERLESALDHAVRSLARISKI